MRILCGKIISCRKKNASSPYVVHNLHTQSGRIQDSVFYIEYIEHHICNKIQSADQKSNIFLFLICAYPVFLSVFQFLHPPCLFVFPYTDQYNNNCSTCHPDNISIQKWIFSFSHNTENQEIIYTVQVSKSVPTPKEAGSMSQIRLIPDTLLPSPVSIFRCFTSQHSCQKQINNSKHNFSLYISPPCRYSYLRGILANKYQYNKNPYLLKQVHIN